mgnify:CR=1 FL=1
MLKKFLVKSILFALKHKELSIEDKNLLIGALLTNIKALQLNSLIGFDNFGNILIEGKPIEYDKAIDLRESARLLNNSFLRRMIQDWIKYKASSLILRDGTNSETILFAKVAIWLSLEEQKIIDQLAQEESEQTG